MAPVSDAAAAHQFILQTYGYYSALMESAPADAGEVLGGRLFWAGKLDPDGRALTVAGNIAGAATFAATSEPEAQRSAVRDGIVDFLVNSLDEALRILKNEIRKRETVAVCVAAPLEAVEREMVERGVKPDVFREQVLHAVERTIETKANERAPSDPMSVRTLVTWRVDRAPALWLPKIDAIALQCLGAKDELAKRWLLRSSRYLGRTGQAEHLVWSDREFAATMFERMSTALDHREIKASGRLEASFGGMRDSLSFAPPDDEPVAP